MEKIKSLYTPKDDKLMDCIAFASTSGTNVEALHKAAEEYRIRAVFCDKKCGAMERAEKQLKLPVIYESGVKFCGTWSRAAEQGEQALEEYIRRCEDYETIVAQKLNDYAKDNDFNIDMVFLAGYMRIVRAPLLEAFPDKMINIHPADLSVIDDQGKRLYDGDNAVVKAIIAGEPATYSSAHLVTPDLDEGEMIVRSKPLEVETKGATLQSTVDLTLFEINSGCNIDNILFMFKNMYPSSYNELIDFADQHQSKQKEYCDWPAFTLAAKMISEGRIAISEKRNESKLRDVYVDGKKMGYGGYCID
ncbi:MAG: formyltransferase family protein [Nanoarchaeota archaeon]|nr:formyltransferase family protein [Nanoarchaeota archaeon]